jgi:hypothetical protein
MFRTVAKWIAMITCVSPRVRIALTAFAVALPLVHLAAATPQSVLDELLAADRAFLGRERRHRSGVRPVGDVRVRDRDPESARPIHARQDAVVAALRANPDNAASRTEWTPVQGGISADGQQGFTVGFMTLHRADGTTIALKYLSYWVKQPDGWRVVAYKRTRAGEGSRPLAMMPARLPAQLVAPSADTATIARHRDSLDRAERSFSDQAQQIGSVPRSRSLAAPTPSIWAAPATPAW